MNDYLKLLWLIFGAILFNTWRDILIFYWRRCTYIGQKKEDPKKV